MSQARYLEEKELMDLAANADGKTDVDWLSARETHDLAVTALADKREIAELKEENERLLTILRGLHKDGIIVWFEKDQTVGIEEIHGHCLTRATKDFNRVISTTNENLELKEKVGLYERALDMITKVKPFQAEGAPNRTWDEINDMTIDMHNMANDARQGREPKRHYTSEGEK